MEVVAGEEEEVVVVALSVNISIKEHKAYIYNWL